MLNNKSLLYGIGTGLIAGAVLLQLMNAAVAPGGAAAAKSSLTGQSLEEMDSKQIKQIASQYFAVYNKEEKLFTQKQVDEAVQQKVKEETDRLAQQASTPVKETYILVNKGMTSAQVGDMLFQSGVITDRKAFEDEMYKRQLNDKIVAGVHVFKGPQELAQVTSNLTTP